MTYPNSSGHLAGSETSEAAARAVDDSGNASSQLNQVVAFLEKVGAEGATADEIREEMLMEWPHIHNAIVSARISRLVVMNKAVKTRRTRLASTGRQQHVYVLARFALAEDVCFRHEQRKDNSPLPVRIYAVYNGRSIEERTTSLEIARARSMAGLFVIDLTTGEII